MKQSAKKLCSLLVVLCLLVGLVPFGAFATESSDSGVEILYQQLVLGDDLTMKFEIAIEESVAEMAEVKLSVGGSETVYTVSELTPNENGNYLVSVDVAAAQMTDTITVTVAVGELEIASKDYTVLAYAEHILNGNYGSATKALVKEMLNYGAKAQTYFDYQAGSLAEYENVTPATMPTEAEAMSVEGSVEGIKFYGSSMLFTGKLAIRYYFTAPNGVEGYTFTDANGNSYEADIKNSMYYVDVAGINPQDIDESVVLTVSDESSSLSVGYGPMNYITRMYNGNGSDNLKNLLQALYGYHLAAEAFVESGETQEEIGELAIPEGARMICDYSEAITPHIPDSWGSGSAAGYYNSYEAFEGRAGVYGMGAAAGTHFMWYNAVGLNDMDLSLAETITFRLMVKSGVRSLQIKHDDTEGIDILQDVTAFDEWIELTYNVADLGWSNLSKASVQFRFANPVDAGESEWIWLDQVYVTEREVTELEIPEGARMICDYSETVTPHIPDSWGSGPSGGYYNTYDVKDGRAGVFGFGANGECFMWYNAIGLNDMDLSLAETITFRMKVDSRIRNLNIKHDDIEEFNLYQYITVFDEWTEVTVNVADLGYSDLSKASIQFQFATWNNGETEYVLLDQVYITERAITELPIPEGAELICDYSESITPHIPDSWGTGPSGAYSNSYDKKDGRAGVFGFGANGECFMWYNGIGLNDLDLSRAESITFRMKVDSRIRNLNIKHDDIEEFNLYQYVTVFDEWTEVTVPVAELGYSNLYNASIQFQFATWNHGEVEYVLLDQVYMTLKADEELVVPTQIPNYEKYRGEKKLDVLAFWMPPIEDIHYQWMQEAGITALVIDNQYGAVEGAPLVKALSLCDKYGIDAYIMISREQANALYPSNYPYVTDHPSLKGFYVDEPTTEEEMNNIAAMVKAAEPMGLTVIVNKMPWTDADYSQWFDTAFADCGDNLIVCATNYPLLTDGVRSDWLEVNGLTAESAATVSAPHWQFVATTGYGDRRQVTEADIRWQYYAALAYGAKGIGDFAYCTPSYGSEFSDPQHAPIWWTDVYDTSTYYRADTYYYLQAVNQEIAKFDHVLLSFDWQGVMTNVKNYFSDSGVALRNATDVMNSHSRIKSLSSNKNLLIGCFKDANDYDGFLLVNFDETQNNSAVNTVSITFNGAQTALAYVHGERQIVTLTNGVFTCDLAPGEAVFVIPVDGTEEAPVSELAIPENATMVAYFPSCENYQGVAGVKALTDGTYTDVLPASFDYSSYSHIVLRVKAAQGASLTVGGKAVAVSTDWTEVAVKLSEISGTDVMASGNVWIDQIYAVKIAEELAIPEGAVMIQDYASGISPFNTPNWGTGAVGFSKWYSEFDGRAGVQAFGLQATDTFIYTAWGGVLPNVDLSEYTHIVFRMKLSKSALRSALVTSLQDGVAEVQLMDYVDADNVWVEFTVKASDVNGTLLAIANTEGADGEVIWMDQVYAIKVAPELEIPEGSTLICDYSEPITPYVPGHWGSGPAAAYSNSYATKDGRAGVLGFGSNCEAFMWYTGVGMDGMDLTNAETITFRMKVDSRIRNLNIKHDNIDEYNLYQHITVFDDWTEVTVNVADLNFADLSNASIQFQFATWNNGEVEYVLLDQVYTTPKAEESFAELAIPEGATLISYCDTTFTPWVNTNWGTHDLQSSWYAQFQGRAGVLGVGSASATNAWNHFSTPGSVSEADAEGKTLVIRYYATKAPLTFSVYGCGSQADVIVDVPVSEFKVNEWAELRVDLTEFFEGQSADQMFEEVHIRLGSSSAGEFFYIDQMYIDVIEPAVEELPIPEQATLFTDYSKSWTPWVNSNWGSHDLTYQWYEEYEGRAGVMGYGSNVSGNSWNWFSLGNSMNYKDAPGKNVVIRLYATQPVLSLTLWATGTNMEVSVPVANIPTNQWYDLTVDISGMVGDGMATGLHLKLGTSVAGQTVFIDSIYFMEEVELPEGAVLIGNFSESYTPWVNGNWGTHDLESQWYPEFQGHSGVLGVGSPSTGNAWNHFSTPGAVSEADAEGKNLVIRYYASKAPLTFSVYGCGSKADVIVDVPVSEFKVNEWAELRVDLTKFFEGQAEDQKFEEVHIRLGSNSAGEFFYIDQMFIEIDESVVWQAGSFGGENVTHSVNTIGSEFENRIAVENDAAKLYIRDAVLDSYSVGDRVKVAFKLYSGVEVGAYSALTVADEHKDFDGQFIGGQWYSVHYFASVESDSAGKYVELGLNNAGGETVYLRELTFSSDALPEELFGGVTVEMLTHTNVDNAQMQGFLMTDGEYVLALDSGYPTDDDHLYEQLLLMAPDAHVDGWFISHGHGDHYGALLELLKDDKVTIGTLYFHFPNATDRNGNTESLALQNEFEAMVQTRVAEGKIGNVVTIGKGGVYTYGDMTIKTLNDAYFGSANFLNDSTVVMKLETPGENLLFLGDLGDRGDVYLEDADFLAEIQDCSVVQMAHHGQNGTTQKFYNACTGMKMALYCAPDWLWNNDNGGGVNSGSWQTLTVRQWLRDMGVGVSYYLDGTDLILE